ncbi:MAG: hypothetical protein R6V02_02945 [Candidatus Aminicenantes bacterium]
MDRRHAGVPSEDIRSDSGFALLSCGEEPSPLSLHSGRRIHHPAPMAQFISDCHGLGCVALIMNRSG